MKGNRLDRIKSEIKKALAQIIDNDLRDPQITAIIGVTNVMCAPDLSYAKVYISSYGEQSEQDVLNRIKGAGSFIRGKLAGKVKLRIVPHLDFFLDGSIEYGNKIDSILSKITYTTNPEDNFGGEE